MNAVYELAFEDSDDDDFERRRHPRRSMEIEVVVDGWRSSLIDLSASGARVRMACPPAVGELVEVEFPLDGRQVRAMALVRRAIDGSRAHQVGLQFVWAPHRMMEALRAAFSGRCAA